MKRKLLAALLIGSPVWVQAAALERTPQSADFILEPGNRVEAGISFVRPSVEGKALNPTNGQFDIDTGSMANNFNQYSISGKYQINDQLSVGLKYEQPFGIDVKYNDNAGVTAGMEADAIAHNLTALVAYKTPQNITFFGGPAYQRVDGSVSLPTMANYSLDLPQGSGWGYVAGAAYEKPEIALRAALTYRSSIKYDRKARESFVHPLAGAISQETDLNFKLPQSVNLNFQTGIAPKTLLLAGVRWTDWTAVTISPELYKTITGGEDLVAHTKDSFQYHLGVGRQLTDKLTGAAIVGYDTGSGTPVSPLGPPNKSYSLHLLGKYQVNDNVDIGFGAQYNWYKDQVTTASVGDVGRFENMNVWGAGVRVGVKW